jgi:hypothetical protein
VRKQQAAENKPERDQQRPAVAGILRLRGHDAEGLHGGTARPDSGVCSRRRKVPSKNTGHPVRGRGEVLELR